MPLLECGTWGAIKRHRNAREPLCDACRQHQRTYNRAYARLRHQSPTYAARKAAEQRIYQHRVYTDPRRVAQLNAARRRRHRLQRAANRNLVDLIAVERFVHGDDTIRLNRAEKACAYKEMDHRGVPRNEIIRRLRISWATARFFASQVVENCLQPIARDGQNDSEAEQRANATRPLTDTPAYPGGRLMPSIAAHQADSCQRVVG